MIDKTGQLTVTLRRISFVLLLAVILVVWSEKMYWYLPGYTFVELVIFYSFPTMLLLWAIDRFRASDPAALALTAALFTLAVEGIITPVIYEDGPLPIVGLYLYAWHGGLSVMFGLYLIRKWALAHRRVALGIASLGMGAVWGLWSTTYWPPSRAAEFEVSSAVWSVSRFSIYVVTFVVVLSVAHLLIGYVWPDEWRPTRSSNLLLGFLTISGILIISTAVPWAPVKLAALTWLLTRRLGRTSNDVTVGSRNVLAELQGRPAIADLAPLSMLAVGATVVYAFMTAITPTDAALTTILWVIIPVQTLGGVSLIVAVWRGSGSHLLPQKDRITAGEHDRARRDQ